MKLTLCFVCFALFCSSTLFSQVIIKETVRFKDTIKIEKYRPSDNGFDVKQIKMLPGGSDILNMNEIKFLKNQTITQVDLVYSDYPKDADFSELNRKRILELYIHLPEAFKGTMIKWNLVKQIEVKSTSEMQKHFHGFTIYYRPIPDFSEEKNEINTIVKGEKKLQDSTLIKTFTRNPSWKNMLVVMDVTGSMSPYTAQLLVWIKANQKLNTFKQIVFFNDDDEKSSNQQTNIDETGIWTIDSKNSDKVIDIAFEAMAKGSHIENDLEAICFALKKYPESKENVVLIADNWEDPCDMHLLQFLKNQKIPIKIVVCGVTDRFNTLYLDIAHATGGSVHTMEEDLTNIATIGEGKTIKLGKFKFTMLNGKFYQSSPKK